MSGRCALATVPWKGFRLLWCDEQDVPPVVEGWIRVYTRYVGICGSDMQKIFCDDIAPFLGHEIVGMTASGEPVVVNPNMVCHSCDMCHKGLFNLCEHERSLGTTVNGALRGWMDVPLENLFRVPSPDSTYTLCDSLAVVLHGIRLSCIQEQRFVRDSVLVIGSGNIARLTVLSLNRMSLIPDVVTRDGVWPYSRALQVGHVFSFCQEAPKRRYGVVFECVGFAQSQSVSVALRYTRPRGMLVVFGVFPVGYKAPVILRSLFELEITIQGVRSFLPCDFQQALIDVEENIELFRSSLPQRVIAIREIDDINEALRESASRKLIVDFEGGRF